MNDTFIHVRVDQELKSGSEQVFENLGLTTSQAIKLFLRQALIWQKLPLMLDYPKENNNTKADPVGSNGVLTYEELRKVTPYVLNVLRAQGQKVP
ncbi:MAG: type II toxin-antitoxin system RelB/DinJ family antitoxin [Candidatus Riflebacteria bacterium]|nr:type II toxin-antitoxin system RelB/DinJ family antitoxin [Candidatus Riflebacteria bacterium]